MSPELLPPHRTHERIPRHLDLEPVPISRSRNLHRLLLPTRQQHRPSSNLDVESKVVRPARRPAEQLAKVVAVGNELDRLEVKRGVVLPHGEDERCEREHGAAVRALID